MSWGTSADLLVAELACRGTQAIDVGNLGSILEGTTPTIARLGSGSKKQKTSKKRKELPNTSNDMALSAVVLMLILRLTVDSDDCNGDDDESASG